LLLEMTGAGISVSLTGDGLHRKEVGIDSKLVSGFETSIVIRGALFYFFGKVVFR
jgi:hypothetical protein